MTTQDAPDWQTVVLPIVVVSTAPSPVVIAPDLLTSVQRAYLANSTGTVDLVAAPQPSAITVVQNSPAISSDGTSIAFSLQRPPTVGNLFVLLLGTYNEGNTISAVSGFTAVHASGAMVWGGTRAVLSTDTTDIALTITQLNVNGPVAGMLYEMAGVDLANPVDVVGPESSYGNWSTTSDFTTTYMDDYVLSVASFERITSSASGTWSSSVGSVSNDGIIVVGSGSGFTEVIFGHGPAIAAIGAQSVTATLNISSGSAYSLAIIAVALRAGASPASQLQARIWALDIIGSSTDNPYIERNDSLQTLLATTGPISRWVSFEPGGLLLPAGTGLTATAVDSADFGVVWQLA